MAYTAPTPADLRTRFPAFSATDDAVIDYWLTDARLIVTDSWIEDDRAPAEMALAAHNMALNGADSAGGELADLQAMGVTDFKSASLSVSFDAETVRRSGDGSYSSTRYGKA